MRNSHTGKRIIALAMASMLAITAVPENANASGKIELENIDQLTPPSDNTVRQDILESTDDQNENIEEKKDSLDKKKLDSIIRSDLLDGNIKLNNEPEPTVPEEPVPTIPAEPEEIKTEMYSNLAFASGKEKPVEVKEVFNEGENASTVYYLKQDGKYTVQVKDANFEGAQLNIGVRYNGGEVQWKTEELTKEDSVFEYTYKDPGRYEVYAWVKEENGDMVGKDPQTGAILSDATTRFVIDKTAPKLTISGVKKNEITNQTVSLQLGAEELNANWENYQLTIIRNDGSGDKQEVLKLKKNDWAQSENKATQLVSFAKDGHYKVIFEGKDKANNVAAKQEISFTVDKTEPQIVSVLYYNDTGYVTKKYENIYSDDVIVVEVTAKDNLSGIDESKVFVTIGSDEDMSNAKTFPARELPGSRYCVFVPKDLGVDQFNDKIVVWAYDKAGNKNFQSTAKLVVTSSKPNISLDYNQSAEEWINEDFKVRVKVDDTIAGLQDIVYKINGKKVKKVHFDKLTSTYSYDLVAKDSADSASGYRISIEATNNCGNKKILNKTVYIDKVKPNVTLSGVENGAYYNANQTIHVEVSEEPSKGTTTTFYAERELDGKKYDVKMKDFVTKEKKDSCDRKLEEEGKYTIYAITEDAAGNQKKSNVLTFVIDKTAPKLDITGVTNGQLSAKDVSVTFQCEESFYEDNQVQIEVERAMNGKPTVEKVGGFNSKGKVSTLQQAFSADGVYKARISAKDKAGNVAESKEVTFTIDQTKPNITISGTDNYEMWDDALDVIFSVEENFFRDMKVSIQGTRTDIDGNVTKLEIPALQGTGAISSLAQQFKEEGIYYIQITAEDKVGNKEVKDVHFTVDRSAPTIQGIKEYDKGYYQEFEFADSLYGMFKDLTVLSYRILLNGIEYDGKTAIKKEGKYTLDIEATDELNHKKNEVIEFIIDRTEPKVIFTGVKNGETVTEKGTVSFSLTEKEDTITAVRMNGKEYDASTRELAFEQYGDYVIEVDSIDLAGNEGHKTLEFRYENPKHGTAVAGGIGFGAVLICAWIVIYSLRKRKEVNK